MYYRCYSIVNNTTANRVCMKKVQLNIKNILSNHLNSYICVHKYRENAYNIIDYRHNSCYLCCATQCKVIFKKGGSS